MTLSLSLLEPSTLESVPEEFDGVLECSSLAICCAFNRRGSLLAVGCNDGSIVIWDFLTRGVAKTIKAHRNSLVCSISWSRDGHKLISASLDNTVGIWKALTGECLHRWKFPSPILKATFNTRNERLVLVCLLKHPSILVEVDYDNDSIEYRQLPLDREEPDPNVVAAFDRRGQHIYSGNARGRISIFHCPKSLKDQPTNEFELISSFRIQTSGSTPAAVREIEFGARNKSLFLVNSTDRGIRLYDCNSALKAGINGSCMEQRKFQDLVNKTMWRRCCFSGDLAASHVCGGSARQHALYIWQTDNGSIKKMLHGTKGELLLDIQWHPLRPIVASISSGLISIWARPQIENWSAFAPDFKELEENMEYEERESEFDQEDEDNIRNDSKEAEMDTSEVDVTGVDPQEQILSSDEEDLNANALECIPITNQDCDPVDPNAHIEPLNPYTINPVPQHPLPLPLPPTSSRQDKTALAPEEPTIDEKKPVEIILENAPIGEAHPLSVCSSKRIRVNDKLSNARKIPKHNPL